MRFLNRLHLNVTIYLETIIMLELDGQQQLSQKTISAAGNPAEETKVSFVEKDIVTNSESMEDLLKTGLFSDLTVVVDGKKIMLHKAIVSARSEYFEAMLKNDFKEKAESLIEIKECSYEGFSRMCEHIYDDKTQIEYEKIYLLMEMADRFGVIHLKKRLECAAVEYITIDNAAKVFKYSNRYNYERIRNICMSYIDEHYSQIIHTEEFAELEKDDILKIVRLQST